MADTPEYLRVEHRFDPLGSHNRTRRLSWQLPAMAALRLAYEFVEG